MTMTASHPESVALSETLSRVSLQRRCARRWGGVREAGWITLACVLGVILFDAVWPLPAWVRCIALGAIAAGLGVVAARLWRTRPEPPLAAARILERAYAADANPLVNGVQLVPTGDVLRQHLARRAVDEGARAAGAMDVARTLDHDARRSQLQRLAAVMLAAVALVAIQPRLIGVGVLRLALPLGDHPPFSFTRFEVAVTPDPLFVGDRAVVGVMVRGRAVSPVEMVELDSAWRELRRWPMSRDSDGRFVRHLLDVREPIMFRIESGRTISRRHSIVPLARPAVDVPTPPHNGDAADAAVDLDALRAAWRDLQRLAEDLLQQALDAGADVDWPAWRERVAELAAMLADLASQSADLALAVDAPVPASEASDEELRDWLRRARDAAAAARGRLGDSADATDAGRRTQQGDAPVAAPEHDPLAAGRYDVTTPELPGEIAAQRAVIEQAPPMYRPLVADYFRLLAESDAPTQEPR
jgi:hypothetical protein